MVIVRVCGRTEQAVEEKVTWEERVKHRMRENQPRKKTASSSRLRDQKKNPGQKTRV